MKPSILILGTADWDQPIATNQHYMARELAVDYEVIFVESIGLRRPEFRLRDLRRVWRRIRPSTVTQIRERDRFANLKVISPLVLPWHSRATRGLNSKLLRRQLRSWLLHPGPRILWCYSPVTYGLHSFAVRTVYHCVDLLGEFPGISRTLIEQGEYQLASAGAIAAGSSEVVMDHLRRIGFEDPVSWPNVAEVQSFEQVANRHDQPARAGTAVFAGNLTPKKVDFTILAGLLASGVRLQLAGPRAEGGGDADLAVEALVRSGAEYLGVLSTAELADVFSLASVGLIPYLENGYTRGVSPLKVYEYLASGMAVVSTPIPAVSSRPPDVIITANAEAFVAAVVASLGGPSPADVDRRASLARPHSWTERGRQARALIREQAAAGGSRAQ